MSPSPQLCFFAESSIPNPFISPGCHAHGDDRWYVVLTASLMGKEMKKSAFQGIVLPTKATPGRSVPVSERFIHFPTWAVLSTEGGNERSTPVP